MRSNVEDLNVRKLIKDVYSELCEKYNPKKIILPSRTLTEISNDSDPHRKSVGYMGYETASLFEFGEKVWVISTGDACGSYPARPYLCDILALKFELKKPTDGEKTEKEIQKELGCSIRNSIYFQNSLFYGLSDGNFGVDRYSQFKHEMLKIVKPNMERFVTQRLEDDSRYLPATTLIPFSKNSCRYKPELVDFLVESIETVLK